MKTKTTIKQKAYMIEYAKDNVKRIYFHLNKTYDADIIEFLNTKPNKNGYLKELIRKDMENQPK